MSIKNEESRGIVEEEWQLQFYFFGCGEDFGEVQHTCTIRSLEGAHIEKGHKYF